MVRSLEWNLYVIGVSVNFIIAFLIILYLIIKNNILNSNHYYNVRCIWFIVSSFLGTFIFSNRYDCYYYS